MHGDCETDTGIAMIVRSDHLGLTQNTARLAILTGDPMRAAWAAERLDADQIEDRRGFDIYRTHDRTPEILVVSTGIGGPATAIVAEELVMHGVRALVRLGTCGAVSENVAPGDLVISSACVRVDGTSTAYLDSAYPAVAHPGLAARITAAVRQADQRQQVPHHVGLTHCKDAYYSEKIGMLPDVPAERSRWAGLRAAGVLATEMEAAALFAVAQLRGVAAAALLAVVGKTDSDRDKVAISVALDATTTALDQFDASGEIEALSARPGDPGQSFLSAGALDER